MKRILLLILCTVLIPFENNWAVAIQLDNPDEELVYLNSDRNVYEVGERIWFSTVHFNSKTLTPQYKSDVLYFLILDQNNNVVERKKFNIRLGSTNGSYLIPSDLDEGIYYLLAYTKNSINNQSLEKSAVPIAIHKILPKKMSLKHKAFKNKEGNLELSLNFQKFDESDFKRVKVEVTVYDRNKKEKKQRYKLNDNSTAEFIIKNPGEKDLGIIKVYFKDDYIEELFFIHLPEWNKKSLELFPEGGFLQPNSEQKVVYHLTNPYESVDSLYVYENEKLIQKIKTKDQLAGEFIITPKVGKKYSIRTDEKSQLNYPLALNSEKNIRLSISDDAQKNKIVAITPYGDFNKEKVQLKISQRGEIIQERSYDVSSEKIEDVLYVLDSRKGVFLLALYNELGDLLSHRFVFIEDNPKLDLKSDSKLRKTYSSNEWIPIEINSLLSTKKVKARYSISIRRKSLESSNYQKNIGNYFLFDSEFNKSIDRKIFEKGSLELLSMMFDLDDYKWTSSNELIYKNPSDDINVRITNARKNNDPNKLNKKSFLVMCEGSLATYTTNENGEFNIPIELLKADNACSLLRSGQNHLFNFHVSDLTNVLDSIQDPINFSATIQKSVQGSTYFSKSDPFTFYGQNLLDEVDIKRKKKKRDFIPHNNDFVCPWNILNCDYCLVTGEVITTPISGRVYRVKKGATFKTIVYESAGEANLPIALLSLEKNQSFRLLMKQNIDLFPKTVFWQHFYTSPDKGKIKVEIIAPESKGIYQAMINAYDANGNLGTLEFDFIVN